ncbi:unnamed protein product [Rotaria sordida]|uniref:Uncharacterized protein n=1 Tax=Rotaria sordida TaxID=392033 RepID=A0A814FDJ0_9BILA|nr:unnamed protein product [Rotaria sordida]CAF1001784.1 unnamed protein product [Rotaria sordida]
MGHGMVGFAVTLISLIHGSFATVISAIVLGIIIYHQYHNRLTREEKITLILSANIYFHMNIYIVVLISCNIQTLLGDIYEKNFDSSWCNYEKNVYYDLQGSKSLKIILLVDNIKMNKTL